jgi:hypothetical protein
MRPALLIGAGLAALAALGAPARAAEPQPCTKSYAAANTAPCHQSPCISTNQMPCEN